MMMYLEGEEIDIDQIRAAIRKATLANQMTPVFVGSAFKNKGVQPLLDGVVDYLPSPLDVPPIQGRVVDGEEVVTREADENGPLAALAFKVQADPHVGKLTYIRVYSGTLKAGSYVMNTTKGRRERVGRLLQMHANSREQREEVYAGELVAAIGLSNSGTGDTLVAANDPGQIVLEEMIFPEPVISQAIEPKTRADQEKLSRSEEHTSEPQSRQYLVCRLLLEKKKHAEGQHQHAHHRHRHRLNVRLRVLLHVHAAHRQLADVPEHDHQPARDHRRVKDSPAKDP